MIYAATITNATLRVSETRIVADLLLKELTKSEWRSAILDDNVLQLRNQTTSRNISALLRARIEPLGKDLWTMIRDGDRDLATQATFAGAIKHSRLLGDFMDLTIREQRTLFAKHLSKQLWGEYIEGCRGRDPEMPHWSESTVAKLRSTVISMLVEAGYLSDTRALTFQNVFVIPELRSYLKQNGERYVLRCMEVME